MKVYLSVPVPTSLWSHFVIEEPAPHVTVFYAEIDEDDLMGVVKATAKSVRDTPPFTLTLDSRDGLEYFPRGENGYPVYFPVTTEPERALHELRARLLRELRVEGVEHTQRHEYNPHATHSYHDEEPGEDDLSHSVYESFDVHSLVLSRDGEDETSFPLRGSSNAVSRRGGGQSNDPSFPIRPFPSSPSPTGPRGSDHPSLSVPGNRR